MLRFFDAHTHTQFPAYDEDRDDVMLRASEAGVGVVNVGTNKETSLQAVRIAEHYNEGVYAVVGIHPTHASGSSFHDKKEMQSAPEAGGEVFDYPFYKELAEHGKTVAIGECGLDYFRMEGEGEAQKEKQKEMFLEHIRLAHRVGKPLMIHCRNAFPDLLEILSANSQFLNAPPGIVHFFTGTRAEAVMLLDMGFSFTFGGVITFVRDYDEVIRLIPKDRILSETDAPYVTPTPYRGKRNEPAYVVEVVKRLAEIKECSFEEMQETTYANAKKIFRLS